NNWQINYEVASLAAQPPQKHNASRLRRQEYVVWFLRPDHTEGNLSAPPGTGKRSDAGNFFVAHMFYLHHPLKTTDNLIAYSTTIILSFFWAMEIEHGFVLICSVIDPLGLS
ncbi:hypothetical protein ACJX0J_009626, partial [Zea mays]